ncbi:MAG TPA: hypothetical protein PLS49_06490 [Candidatus Woesebacteria bacterium]|nr:hypothetical protein [Candidatus Woesebacteria bacterium]
MKLDIFKIIIGLSLLIVSASVAYYFVIFLPNLEKQKIEQQESAQKLKQQQLIEQKNKQEENELSLSRCLLQAEESYHENWNSECESQGRLSSQCIELLKMSIDEYMQQNNFKTEDTFKAVEEFYNEQSECSCRLPFENSDRIDSWRESAKNECYRKYNN